MCRAEHAHCNRERQQAKIAGTWTDGRKRVSPLLLEALDRSGLDGLPFHLHMHVVPRFDGDEFRVPDPHAVEEVPRSDRLAQARELRGLLA